MQEYGFSLTRSLPYKGKIYDVKNTCKKEYNDCLILVLEIKRFFPKTV